MGGRLGPRVGARWRRPLKSVPPRAIVTRYRESQFDSEDRNVGSVIKKRRKRMAKKKHRKLLKRTRVQRRNKK